MLRFLTASAAAVLFSGAALAADLPMSEPPAMQDEMAPAAAFDWTGFYVGLNGGWGWGHTVQHNNIGVTTGNFNIDGFVGGAQAGYDLQWRSLVVGAEADIQYSGISGSSSVAVCAGTCRTDINWFGTVRGRAGVALGRLFVFGTGGLAYGEVEANCCGGAFNVTDTNIGWTAGGGVEVGLTKNLTLKGEYLFVDLGNVSQNVGGGVRITADADHTNVVRGGLNWKFGGR